MIAMVAQTLQCNSNLRGIRFLADSAAQHIVIQVY